MARFRLLTPDAQYSDDAVIERRTAGPDVGTIAGAGLDVLPTEPPKPDDLLAQAYAGKLDGLAGGRLILTPHAAWSSPESVADARRLAVETALLYLREGKLRNLVNAPAERRQPT